MKHPEEVEESRGQEGGLPPQRSCSAGDPGLAPALPGNSLAKGVRGVLAGRISLGKATLEAFRRGRAAVKSRRERAMLAELAAQPARLRTEFQNTTDLLTHFRERTTP